MHEALLGQIDVGLDHDLRDDRTRDEQRHDRTSHDANDTTIRRARNAWDWGHGCVPEEDRG
jgi:hypothetical protein